MKSTSKIILLVLFLLASVGRAQVVLPPSSEYNDPYNYYRDCVSNNGEENQTICEQQTGALFPEEEAAPVQEDSAQAEPVSEDGYVASNTAGE